MKKFDDYDLDTTTGRLSQFTNDPFDRLTLREFVEEAWLNRDEHQVFEMEDGTLIVPKPTDRWEDGIRVHEMEVV